MVFGTGTVAQQMKALPAKQHPKRGPGHVQAAPLVIKPPAPGLGQAAEDGQVFGPLPIHGRPPMKLLGATFSQLDP